MLCLSAFVPLSFVTYSAPCVDHRYWVAPEIQTLLNHGEAEHKLLEVRNPAVYPPGHPHGTRNRHSRVKHLYEQMTGLSVVLSRA